MTIETFARRSQTRRQFLQASGAGIAALTIGFSWYPRRLQAGQSGAPAAELVPNAFVRIGADDSVTVIAKHVEMGQGAYTGLATILAEELDADWARVRVESAPADAKRYANLVFKTMQGTGGSSAIANSWQQLREAGASARALLVSAAAKEWHTDAAELRVERGVIYHDASKRQARFGSLVKTAMALPVPTQVALKDPRRFTLVGTRPARVDVPAKCDGTAQFSLDVVMPELQVALLARAPQFGATVASFDPAGALAVPGVVKVVQVPRGIAVVARSFWAAKKGRDRLAIQWDDTQAEKRSSAQIMAEYRKLADAPATPARRTGDAVRALEAAATTVGATFEFPYLAHAPMEPLDCVVKLTAQRCDIWAGDQFQTIDQSNAAKAAGLEPAQVFINTLYAGGSFGRRANAYSDYIVEAVSIAKACGADGTPIKLQWTREDDLRGGLYRPMYFHKLEAGLDANHQLTAWRHVIVGQSIMAGTIMAAMIKDGIDPTSVEGAATIAYDIPHIGVDLTTTTTGVPVLWWRVVGSSHTTFAVETFLDQVAHAAGKDPFEFRRGLLGKAPRMKAVLELAAQKAGWSAQPLPKGRGRGIAVAEAFKTFVAQVVEVSVQDSGRIKVERVVCAVDCGIAVNPDVITAQMEGGIGFGLGAVLWGNVTLDNGRVEQSNFNDYRVLRMNEMPKVEVYIVPSAEAPTGVGEPGVAPIGPALANAVFAATGKRISVLPFAKSGLA
jgi:isoquinoline 1-oxidoreductase subunit beta